MRHLDCVCDYIEVENLELLLPVWRVQRALLNREAVSETIENKNVQVRT